MNELELRLVELGRELELPAEPDLAPRILVRAREKRRPVPWRAAAVALAVLALALGAALAVPQARSAILRFFHLGGETVIRVDELPPAAVRSGLGRPLPLAQAQRQVGFRLLLPPLDDPPRRVYVVGDSLATVVLRDHGRRVLLSEFPSQGPEAVKKLVLGSADVQPASVDGRAGLWVVGPHTFSYYDRTSGYRERPVRIEGNVLIWLRGDLTLRLEGRLSRRQALELARSIG